MIQIIDSLKIIYKDSFTCPSLYFSINFILSCFFSIIFMCYLTKTDLKDQIPEKLEKESFKIYRKIIAIYSCFIGLTIGFLLYKQFQGIQILSTIIYSLAGAFILKDHMLKNVNKNINEDIHNISKECITQYEKELKKIDPFKK